MRSRLSANLRSKVTNTSATDARIACHRSYPSPRSGTRPASYEGGRRRLPVALLPALAQHLAVSVEALLGPTNGASKRGPTPKFQRHLEQLSRLPRARQRFVLDMLETVLQQASR
jgi:hypothetical protein